MNSVVIVQPAVPLYRKPFFEGVQKKTARRVCIYTADTDFLKVRSVPDLEVAEYHKDHGFVSIFSDRLSLFWQRGLNLRFSKGDQLVINGNPRILSNFRLVFIAKVQGAEVIWWGHGWSSTSKKWTSGIRQVLMRLLADKVMLYTEKERSLYIKAGFDPEKIFALNNGVNAREIEEVVGQVDKEELAVLKSANGLEGYQVGIFIGRLTEKSNLKLLVEAAPRFAAEIKIIVVGDGDMKQAIEQRVSELGCSNNFCFTGAIFDEGELAKWTLVSDFFVYPGAVGLSLLHAFSYGLPAVIHNNESKHMPEHAAFEEGVNGLSFEEGSETDLAKVMLEMGRMCRESDKMAVNARETVRDSYNIEDMVARFVNALSA